jgi:glycosyltransferase involved in cell wall biosynthesis
MGPKISIVTPSYNAGSYLREAVLSVLNQDYENYEYIVVDGGSTDGTMDILKDLAQNHPRRDKFRWISEKDRGQTDAINKGLRLSTGEWFAFLNADDHYEANVLRDLGPAFARHSDKGVLYGNCKVYYEDLPGKDRLTYRPPSRVDFKTMSAGNQVFGPSSFYNMQVLRRAGEFDDSLHYWMDYDMYLRISKMSTLQYVDNDIATFRINSGQKSPSDFRNKIIYSIFQKEAHYVYWKNGGGYFNKLLMRRSVTIGRIIFWWNRLKGDSHYLRVARLADGK